MEQMVLREQFIKSGIKALINRRAYTMGTAQSLTHARACIHAWTPLLIISRGVLCPTLLRFYQKHKQSGQFSTTRVFKHNAKVVLINTITTQMLLFTHKLIKEEAAVHLYQVPPDLHRCCAPFQQAWPSGTQQILLPPAWQQLTHTSVQHATVIPDAMSSTQPLANWR